jgi:NitT/TauT family transport system permease protein
MGTKRRWDFSLFVTPLILLGLWFLACDVLMVPGYVLPTPQGVWKALVTGYVLSGALTRDLAFTTFITIGGFICGSVFGFILGALLAEFRPLDRMTAPYIIAFQALPKVAIAPLLLVWLGFGIFSKIVLVTIMCFFPVLVNTQVGLQAAPPELIDLMRAFSASRWLIFWKIKVPAAAGHLFAGLQVSAVLGLIGAVVAEFVSSTVGLGHAISTSALSLDTGLMFAALLSLTALGVVVNTSLRWLHHRVVFWDRRVTVTEAATKT